MTNLEFRVEVILFFTVLSVFAPFNANADFAPNGDMSGSADNPRDKQRTTLDQSPELKGLDNDDDDDVDDAIGDEGFYDEDDDDDGDNGVDSLGQSFQGYGFSVVHKKDEIHRRSENTDEHAQQQKPQLSVEASANGDGDVSNSSSGSGSLSGDAEVKVQGNLAKQHVLENEESDDEDTTFDKDDIDDEEDEGGDTDKGKVEKQADVMSNSSTQDKHPKNVIRMVVNGSKELQQEEEGSSQAKNFDEESSGEDSESPGNFVWFAEEHPSLQPHPTNMTVGKNDTSGKTVAKANVTLLANTPDKSHKGSDNQSEKDGSSETKEGVLKDGLKSVQHHKDDKSKGKGNTKDNVEHKPSVQNTNAQNTSMKKELGKAAKLSPHFTTGKLHNKYAAAHVKQKHVLTNHAKTVQKTVSKALPLLTCRSNSILAGHSLKGGTRAGRFETMGETASMQACLQRCCNKKSCDVALLIDGRCYGVACFSEELCKPVPVPHPHFVFSQIGFLNKGHKRGDIERTQEFHCQYGNLTLRNNENWSGELCGGVVRCKDGIASMTKCPGIPSKPDDCAKPRLIVKHQRGKCCQMKWKCKARHCIFNNRLIKHGYKLSDPLCTGVVSCYNGHLSMEYCPKIPKKPKDCARPKLKTINVPGKCCKKLWVCSDKSCTYDSLKLSHGEKLTDASCAVVMECKNGFLHNRQCPGPPPVPHKCINPTLRVKRVPGECCEMSWTCEIS